MVRRTAPWIAAAAAPFAGLGLYLWWLQATLDDGAGPFRIQGELRAGWREPVTRSIAALLNLVTGEFRDVYNVAFAAVLIVLAVVAVRDRLPVEWTSYLIIGLAVALSANNIDSIGRYGMMLAPAWALGLGSLTSRRWVYASAVALSSAASSGSPRSPCSVASFLDQSRDVGDVSGVRVMCRDGRSSGRTR